MKRQILPTILAAAMAATPVSANSEFDTRYLDEAQAWYHSSRAKLEQSIEACPSQLSHPLLDYIQERFDEGRSPSYPAPSWEAEIKQQIQQGGKYSCLEDVMTNLQDHNFAHSSSQVALRETIVPLHYNCIQHLGNENPHLDEMLLQHRQYSMTFFVPISPEVAKHMIDSENPYCIKVVELSENSPVILPE